MNRLQTRTRELAQGAERALCQSTDRMFAGLLLFQWVKL